MSEKVAPKKEYQKPIVMGLGEMARGLGACVAGPSDVIDCTAGGLAQNACTAGPTNNGATCSAGGSASPTCTDGSAPG